MHPAIETSQRAYSWLIYLYPGDFRREFAGEMQRAFEDDLRDAWQYRRFTGLAETWLTVLYELLTVALLLQLRSNLVVATVVSLVSTTLLYTALGHAFADKSHAHIILHHWRL